MEQNFDKYYHDITEKDLNSQKQYKTQEKESRANMLKEVIPVIKALKLLKRSNN